MSVPDIAPESEPISDSVPVASESNATVAGAISYLEAAQLTANTQAPVDVSQIPPESITVASATAEEHGFGAFLAAFESSIEHEVAQITAGVSEATKGLLAKGIAALKSLI